MSGRRCALLIATQHYESGAIQRLRAPAQDVARLTEVLRDPAIGDFEVETLVDAASYRICEAVAHFFADRERDDLLLLYFSGHGFKDTSGGKLYLGAANTQLQHLLSATAVAASFINDHMRESRSRRKVLLLDCCYSGAFARGMTVRSDRSVGVRDCFQEGNGHAVLTASDATQYAFEGDEVSGTAEPSVFTRVLIEGLATGKADANQDGHVTFDELADYVSRGVTALTPGQRPQKWEFGAEGALRLASNPRPIAVPLPQSIVDHMRSGEVFIREAVVRELGQLLGGSHPGLAVAAREALEKLAHDDSRRVLGAARVALGWPRAERQVQPGADDSLQPGGGGATSVPPTASRRWAVLGLLGVAVLVIVLKAAWPSSEPSVAEGTVQGPSVSSPTAGEYAPVPPPVSSKPSWAVAADSDQYGRWADIKVGDARARLRWIEPGSFKMGSPKGEQGRDDDEVQHQVELTKGYWLGETEVTQALWSAVMGGENPSYFKSRERPVENVSWKDAQEFLTRLNGRIKGLDARLPTEAEWEYASRAGTTTSTYAGELKILGQRNGPVLDEIAWYGGNSGANFDLEAGYDSSGWDEKQYPHKKAGTRLVKQKRPNRWGLYDMLGNVWEWCSDWYGPYDLGASSDPSGVSEGSKRVIRGGSWYGNAGRVRAADRGRHTPEFRDVYLGFRIARGQGRGSE